MTNSTESIGSTSFGGIPYEGWSVDDLAFTLAAYQLESLDDELKIGMGRLQILSETRKAYRERITQIQEWLTGAEGNEIEIPADEARKFNYEWVDGKIVARSEGNLYSSDAKFRLSDPEGGSIEGTEEQVRAEAVNYPDSVVVVKVKKEALEAEVQRLQGKLDDLGGDSEIELLTVNRLLSRRNQALQLASNVVSTTHQAAMGIISNIK